jgi:D-lactate dehydrogenase
MTTATVDRAPEWVAAGTPEPLRSDLAALVGEDALLARASDLVRFASDASPYRVIPRAVIQPRDAASVSRVLAYARANGIAVTLRGGGTSLNGQGQGAGILVDVRRHWGGIQVADGAESVRVGPGTLLGHVNRVLAPFGRRLGPDPASTDIATVGGVIANNSGGMRCGTTADPYSTVLSMKLLLASGTRIDTAVPDAAARFEREEPEIARGLAAIRDEVRADSQLTALIRRKFQIKNTTGYRLCAFLDADEPVEILRRLVVGSEGTLAVICEAELATVAVPPMTTTAWLHFAGIREACEPVPALVAAGARAVELMVAPALMVASMNIPGTPAEWQQLPPESAVLLVELGGEDDAALDAGARAALAAVGEANLIRPVEWHRGHEEIELDWRVREGLHGLVGRMRPPSTALIVEDVCVPPARIAEAADDIRALLGEHGFLPGVAGHASAGNLHFMLTPDFSESDDTARYEAFMEKLVDLVLAKYDGSLKAEHGTGVNMAPYVEREWGERATRVMWRVKELCDPDGVLGPGVVLSRDPGIHLRNLKTTPEIEEVANHCVECGFCEPVCPSRELTTTPRQRIVLRREMERQPAGSAVRRALEREYEYDALATCAADGTCALNCPLSIDTGRLVKELRARRHSRVARTAAMRAARSWAWVERASRAGLRTGAVAERLTGGALPRPAPPLPETNRDGAAAVYLPSCTNRIMGRSKRAPTGPSLPDAVVALSARAGRAVWIPDDAPGHCCGVPFSSKGHREAHAWMAAHTVDALWRWSDGGALPVVCDASSCTLGLRDEAAAALSDELRARHAKLEILDSVEWALRLVPELELRGRVASAVVHPTCATRHLGLSGGLAELAAHVADEVTVPVATTCCGFAGDRGMLRPELAESATAPIAREIHERGPFDLHLSANRTCEVGMERATGAPYSSIVLALEGLSR